MIELLFPGWLAGILLSIIIGPLGSFIIWNRMSYFGDTIAHSSILGIAFGLLLNINPFYTTIVVLLILTFILVFIEKQSKFNIDTFLGIIAHSSLSFGLVIISFIKNIRIDFMSCLFGDLLSINYNDILIISIMVFIISMLIFINWNKLLSITTNYELAFVEKINIKKIRLLLLLMIAITIGITMKFIGILIINSLLIIPAAIARFFSKTPEEMAIISIIISIISITTGLFFSTYYDTPTGPSIVLCSTILFILSFIIKIKNIN
ncbi:zinc ABC transporter permease subunit ZnuB [Candidatus Providencia siddallii]|uniref:High-affinity zinc uptake system membrane protein ZnuB n=1 Tax=Candidatus Providencia siddallii TaxID=1715285 RepID=A0ABM9NPU1_9GAMM